MKTKTISLAVLSLSMCTLAIAGDYMAPDVAFKKVAPTEHETKMVGFNDDYKVEGAVKTDRQIASEKEPSEREPSSVIASDMKKEEVKDEMEMHEKPQPWLFKNKLDH